MGKLERVGIIGAGPSGLVCAKVLLDDGFDVTLFERQRELGGIWCAESAYADLKSQQPGGTFEFSDLSDGKEFASWQHVHDYLEKYADLFHIRERIQFETRVVSVYKEDLKNGNLPWIIHTERTDGEKSTSTFDFVVVASGLYSEAYIPFYQGQSKFAGPILPPGAIKSTKQLENQRVMIVGGGKCATDMAVLAGRHARSCHLVFRQAHWLIPIKLVHGLLPARLLFSRVFSILFPPIPGAPYGVLFLFLHRYFSKVFTILNKIISADITSTHGPDLSDDQIFIPQRSFRDCGNISMMPPDFLQLKREGRFVGKLGMIDQILDETTVRLTSGEEFQADMIISATGFIRRFSFFSEEHTQLLGLITTNGNTELHHYRRILPVGIPNIAFLGFTGSFANWFIAEIASHWISDYFLKRLKLPKSKEMREEVRTAENFILKTFKYGKFDYRYYWSAPAEIYLNDMALNLHRTNNWLSEYFGVYRPERIKGLHNERKIIAQTGRKPSHFYFSFTLNLFLLAFLILIYFFFFK